MARSPLLIQGLFDDGNGIGSSIVSTPGTLSTWNNKTQEGRGNMIMVDVVPTGLPSAPNTNLGILNLLIGGFKILQNVELSGYLTTSFARSYELLQLVQPPAQSIQFNLKPVDTVGAVVHIYYENDYAIPAIIAARNTSILKQRIVEFHQNFVGNVKLAEGISMTIPTGIGNVVGIQFICTGDVLIPGNAAQLSLITCLVDSVSILQNAATRLFTPDSTRPGLIFPIFIRGGSTMILYANTDAATLGSVLQVTVRLYFDEN